MNAAPTRSKRSAKIPPDIRRRMVVELTLRFSSGARKQLAPLNCVRTRNSTQFYIYIE